MNDNFIKHMFDDVELYSSPASLTSEDIWKKFDLPTPPRSPSRSEDLDWESVTMPFDLDTEDLLLFEDDDNIANIMKDLAYPETPPLHSNLIQDIMWSAPISIDSLSKAPSTKQQLARNRCDSFSGPISTCVAPEDVCPMEQNIAGTISHTRLGLDTPSDSEEEIDVVTVEKNSVTGKRKYKSDDETQHQRLETKTVTLTIKHSGGSYVSKKCTNSAIRQKVDCPTDVHNYSLPVTSLKRVRSFPASPDTHRSSKKLKRDICVPSDLRKVAQKLKSSMSSSSCSSRSSSDSEEFCEAGKRTQHNVLERKRRTDLKNSFFHLRDSVPELEGQERAPKVVILRKASQYIHRLIEDSKRYEREHENLKLQKEKLRRRLAQLRDY